MIRKYVYMFGIALVCMQAGAMEKQQDVSPEQERVAARTLVNTFNEKLAGENNGLSPETLLETLVDTVQAALAKLLTEHTASLQKPKVKMNTATINTATIKDLFLKKFNENNSAESSIKELFFVKYELISAHVPNYDVINKMTIETQGQSMAENAWDAIMKNVGLSNDGCCVIL